MSVRVFPIKTKPATVCKIVAIDKGLHRHGIRRVKAKHAKHQCKVVYSPPSEAQFINVRKYNRGAGLSRFA